MAIPLWTPDLSVGDRVLDAQHEELLRTIQRLAVALERRDAPLVLRRLDHLVEHVQAHCAEEEALMADFPGAGRHRQAHHRLLMLLQGYQIPGGPVLNAQVLVFLRAWMVDHFQKEDRPLARHLRLGQRQATPWLLAGVEG